MDREKFEKLAPIYYAIAIAATLRAQSGSTIDINRVVSRYGMYQYQGEVSVRFLSKKPIIDAAFNYCVEKQFIEKLEDDFGPTIFIKGRNFDDAWAGAIDDVDSVFHKYSRAGGDDWLKEALMNVNDTFDRLGLKQNDEGENDSEDEWTPLPLERSDPKLKTAIKQLEKIIENVRTDNGYAATHPHERAFVLDGLTQGTKILKEEKESSWRYIRTTIFDNLQLLVIRFKDGALGILAKATRDGLVDYLKDHGGKFIKEVLKSYFGI